MVFVYSLAVDCNFPPVLENSGFIQKILYSIWYSHLPHFCVLIRYKKHLLRN